MTLIEMLKRYNQDKAYIQSQELRLEGLRESLKAEYNPSLITACDIIDEICLSSKVISDMPSAPRGQFHSSTEDAALSYRERLEQSKQHVDRSRIHEQIAELTSRMHESSCRIRIIDAVLLSLSAVEHFVITRNCIDNMQWSLLEHEFNRRFGEYRDRMTLKRIKNDALRKMQEVLQA